MIIAHKIALDPNDKQATYFAKASGVARFAYNWALAEWQRQYEAHKADPAQPKPSQIALRRQLNAIKRERFPWMADVTKNAPQMAIIQLGNAFKNFFAGRANSPRFRKKGVHDRFTLTNDQFAVDGSLAPSCRPPSPVWLPPCTHWVARPRAQTWRRTGATRMEPLQQGAEPWGTRLTRSKRASKTPQGR